MNKEEILELATALHTALYKFQNDGNDSLETQQLVMYADDIREQIYVFFDEEAPE